MKALFGPGGNSKEFYDNGNKSTKQAPLWVKNYGLEAYEYEAGSGLTAGENTLKAIGEEAKINNILMSLHTPYFISLSSVEEEKRDKSCDYILKSAEAVRNLGGNLIVIHAGSAAKIERELATKYAVDTIEKALNVLRDNNLYGVRLGIETMGKINQLGTLSEVLEICQIDETVVPVVDFGHMNAREHGQFFLNTDDYKRVFEEISKKKGAKFAETLHCHFSKIEYSKGGEKKHLTFEDKEFGPNPIILMQAIAELEISPTIICESDGTMDKDALTMKKAYNDFWSKK